MQKQTYTINPTMDLFELRSVTIDHVIVIKEDHKPISNPNKKYYIYTIIN